MQDKILEVMEMSRLTGVHVIGLAILAVLVREVNAQSGDIAVELGVSTAAITRYGAELEGESMIRKDKPSGTRSYSSWTITKLGIELIENYDQ